MQSTFLIILVKQTKYLRVIWVCISLGNPGGNFNHIIILEMSSILLMRIISKQTLH